MSCISAIPDADWVQETSYTHGSGTVFDQEGCGADISGFVNGYAYPSDLRRARHSLPRLIESVYSTGGMYGVGNVQSVWLMWHYAGNSPAPKFCLFSKRCTTIIEHSNKAGPMMPFHSANELSDRWLWMWWRYTSGPMGPSRDPLRILSPLTGYLLSNVSLCGSNRSRHIIRTLNAAMVIKHVISSQE